MRNPFNDDRKHLRQLAELARIVSAAGGMLRGRTKLQRTAYLLDLGGFGCGYEFDYTRYGPFSEELDRDANYTHLFYDFEDEKNRSEGGGIYSVFKTGVEYQPMVEGEDLYKKLVTIANGASSIILEMTAEAAYFAAEGEPDPWEITRKRNPFTAPNGGLEKAKELYKRFKALPLPRPLPDI